MRSEVERFLRRLGYRLVLAELKHPAQVQPDGLLTLNMLWQNNGSAPCYRPYRLAYRLTDSAGKHHTLVGQVTVDKWLPGEVELFTEEFFRQPPDLPPGKIAHVTDAVRVPANLAPGSYALAIAVVGERDLDPVVQLGIQGRTADGWYPLSKITIANK